MKIRTTLTFFFLLIFSGLYSQTQEPSFKVSLLAGSACPLGNFANNMMSDSGTEHSAAKPGPSLTVSFSYRFRHSRYGVEAIAGWQQNNVDNFAMARTVYEHVPPGTQVYAKSDNWHIWKFLAGPRMEIPLTRDGKTGFECAALVGILKTTIPGYEVGIVYSNPSAVEFYSMAPISLPVAFCYQVKTGIYYRITPALSATSELSFMHAAPVHEFTYYQNPLDINKPIHVKQSYPISTLNFLLGISYTFR
jgi:hypothetical protein